MKLIAIDMDGTLLNSKNKVSKIQLNYLEKIVNRTDIIIVVTTGRPIEGISNFIPSYLLEKMYIIALNGTIILNQQKQVISEFPIINEDVLTLQKFALKHNIEMSILDRTKFYTLQEPISYIFRFDLHLNNMELSTLAVEDISKLKAIFKVQYIIEPIDVHNVYRTLPDFFYDKFCIINSAPYLIEFMAPCTNKGYAVKELCNYLQINMNDVYTIGDGKNDLPMFNITDNSIAMDNATDAIKKHAKYITMNNNENGVKYAIQNYVLN
ncbi:Cof-type HAD-IIB family hydrolase [Staphylococcus pseudoxylosus]|uniref:HAD family phosphatase n=1 Tax=Staphylococcus pseudoxylosus TaxID=2282419 RepID=A0AAQ0S5I2_9STAP|nr:Cof-type HAD-IIB family hydrolase [Staphylococcus pseudoxylosus]MCE5003670.1 HAD family phosphatase [Staphylococcus pseudoxylosus]RMI83878.1 HAD family phosphatase [Staphylococcus pseudoxylosus]